MSTYNFPTHVQGDTFNGVSFTVTVNSVALDLTSAIVECEFNRVGFSRREVLTTVSSGGITITDAANGIFEVDEQIISWPPGIYTYDCEIILSNGNVKTYFGGTWEITADITNG